jgi:DNA recombination-dependent growth factor C
MPILRGATTFSRYRVETEKSTPPNWKRTIPAGLRARAFEPLKPEGPEERSAGFVELHNRDETEFTPATIYELEYALFSLRVDEVRIPASVVKDQLERWSRSFQNENHRPPGRKEKNDAKAEIRSRLRTRFPLATRTFDVSWNLETAQLQVWAGSRKAVEEVEAALELAFKVKLVPQVPVAVATALGIAEKSLAPTPALSLPEASEEVGHGQA